MKPHLIENWVCPQCSRIFRRVWSSRGCPYCTPEHYPLAELEEIRETWRHAFKQGGCE